MNTNTAGTTAPTAPENWQQVLSNLERERNQLQQEIVQLRTERDQLSKALITLLGSEVTLGKEDILSQMGQEKPLREFLADLRTQLAGD